MEQTTDESRDLVATAASIKAIADPEQYRMAARLRGEIKSAIDYHTARLDPLIKESNQHTANLRKERAEHVDPLEAKYRYLGDLLAAYHQAEKKRAEQKQLEEEARVRREELERKQRLAELAREIDDAALAQTIEQAPVELPPVVVRNATPPAQETGVSFATTKHYRVEDPMALVKAVAEGKAPLAVLFDPSKELRSSYLHTQTTQLYSTIKPDPNGKRWLYPGVAIWAQERPRQ